MLAFRRVDDRVVCQFEPAELSLLSGLISQLMAKASGDDKAKYAELLAQAKKLGLQ